MKMRLLKLFMVAVIVSALPFVAYAIPGDWTSNSLYESVPLEDRPTETAIDDFITLHTGKNMICLYYAWTGEKRIAVLASESEITVESTGAYTTGNMYVLYKNGTLTNGNGTYIVGGAEGSYAQVGSTITGHVQPIVKVLTLLSPLNDEVYNVNEKPTISFYHENIEWLKFIVNGVESQPMDYTSVLNPVVYQFEEIEGLSDNAINEIIIKECDPLGNDIIDGLQIQSSFTVAEDASSKYIIINSPVDGYDYNINSLPRVAIVSKNLSRLWVRAYPGVDDSKTPYFDKYYNVPEDGYLIIGNADIPWIKGGDTFLKVQAVDIHNLVYDEYTKTIQFSITSTGEDYDPVISDTDGDGYPDYWVDTDFDGIPDSYAPPVYGSGGGWGTSGPRLPDDPSSLDYLEFFFLYIQYSIGVITEGIRGILYNITGIFDTVKQSISYLPSDWVTLGVISLSLGLLLKIIGR